MKACHGGSAWRLPVERWTSDSGLRVVVQPDHRRPAVAVFLALDGGVRGEPPGLSGLAHLCEHLTHAGLGARHSESYPALVRRRGGLATARTWHDHLTFGEILPPGEERLGLWIEADRLRHRGAAVSGGLVEAERRVLLAERRERLAGQAAEDFEELHRLLYPPEHPYHRPPLGLPEGLARVGPRDVEGFLRAHFRPANATLAVAGDVDTMGVRAAVESFSADLATAEAGEPGPLQTPSAPALPPVASHRRHRRTGRGPGRAYVAWTVPGRDRPGWHEAVLLATALAVGEASPLVRYLVGGAGLAAHARVHLVSLRQASSLIFAATAAPGVEVERLASGLAAVLDELLALGVDGDRLESARRRVLRELALEIDQLERRGELLAELALTGDDPHPAARARRYAAVTPRDLAALARRDCGPERRAILTTAPAAVAGGGR